tara:strand:- start:726 stop:1370 length:645 start_codon:yes stop_codon:yes gene_type:complete
MININKDTKIYCSFSNNPGNNGCQFFNKAFKDKNLNSIYKSFYSDDLEQSITSAKHLAFSGFAISSPFKIQVINFLDEVTEDVKNIGSCNTVLINNDILIGYNTDVYGIRRYFGDVKLNTDLIYIIGDGGFAKAVEHVCKDMSINYKIISRGLQNWETIKTLENKTLFNATPIDIDSGSNLLIDGRPFTGEGKKIARYQAMKQFELYTGINYES